MSKSVALALIGLLLACCYFFYLNTRIDSLKSSILDLKQTAVLNQKAIETLQLAKDMAGQITSEADADKAKSSLKYNSIREDMKHAPDKDDDVPLSDADIKLMCRAYGVSDGVCSSPVEPSTTNSKTK